MERVQEISAARHDVALNDTALPVYFITGNSRSGTTMMMRIMDNHPWVHSINEPHFFEKMWSPQDEHKEISVEVARALYLKLLTGQRDGFFEQVSKHKHKYLDEVEHRLSLIGSPLTRLDVYTDFMHHEARKEGKKMPCEKTPQNIFYIPEILRIYPHARIINMVRDPRGVMLSQKKKWKRRALGADFITRKEVLRLRINYHPITVSRLWNSAMAAGERAGRNPEVLHVRFEELLKAPERVCMEICQFLGIEYREEMLMVPHAGSSTEADAKDQLGIRKSKAKSWKEKGLNDAEVQICQRVCAHHMQAYGYEKIAVKPSVLTLIGYYLSFPFKIALALLINLNRMRSIADTLRRRLGNNQR